MHKENRIDTLDVFKYDNGYSTVIYTDQGPLILTEEYAKSVDGVTMHSDFASRLGVFDKKQTYEGFCFARDKNGVTQLMYALITNCIYKGAQKDGVEDGGVSIFDGFYRLPNGKFVDLYEEYPIGQKNEMFRELEDMFDAKWQFLHNAGAIVLKGEETITSLGNNSAPKIGIDGYPEVDENGEEPYLAQGDYPDYDA